MSPARILAAFILLCAAAPAGAQPQWRIERAYPAKVEFCPCCRTQCLKPWSIPDRWDDTSVIPGQAPWAGNGHWDHEPFQDASGNGYHDSGETFTDQNGDGLYNEEFYHPFQTGYVAWKDAGRPLILVPGSNSTAMASGQYNALDLTDETRDDPTGSRYEWDIRECNFIDFGPGDVIRLHPGAVNGPMRKGVEGLIARDPEVHWDPSTQRVVGGSDPETTPRIVFIGLSDPRVEITSGRQSIVIVKLAAFFIEGIDENANLIGRFIRVQSPNGRPCPPDYPVAAAFISSCRE